MASGSRHRPSRRAGNFAPVAHFEAEVADERAADVEAQRRDARGLEAGHLDDDVVRVLVADDHPGMTAALTRLLKPSFDVVGQVSDGLDLFDAAMRLRPDVVVLDVQMPGLNGLDACRRLTAASAGIRVILCTAADDDDVHAQAFEMGASAVVPKMRAADDLVTAIREAVAREPMTQATHYSMRVPTRGDRNPHRNIN